MVNRMLIFVLALCVITSQSHASSTPMVWSPPATIQTSPLTSLASKDVFTACNPNTGQFLAVWADESNSSRPTYSFYEPATGIWSPPTTFPGTTTVYNDVQAACDPSTGVFLAVWSDPGLTFTYLPAYSIYDPSTESWSTATTIPGSNEVEATVTVTCTGDGQFLALWTRDTTDDPPYYSFYDVGTDMWSTPSAIPNNISPSTSLGFDIYAAYAPTTGQILAVWANDSYQPTYSFYSAGAWETPQLIPNPDAITAYENVHVTCNTETGQFLAVWSGESLGYFATYALYTPGTGWGDSTQIPGSSAFEVETNVYASCDPTNGEFLVTWAQDTTQFPPTYSFYTLGTNTWSTPTYIPNNTSPGNTNEYNVFSSFDPTTGQFLATWGSASASYPTYSFFVIPPSPSGASRSFQRPSNRR